MALEANAYDRSAANTDGIIPNLYNDMAEKYLYEAEVLRPLLIQDTRMLNKPGASVDWFKDTAFSVSSLTEGTDTPVSALDFGKVQITVSWFGDAKQMSKEVISESFDFLLDNLRRGASGALGTNRDVQIMSEFLNTTSTAVYPISTGTTRYNEDDIVAAKALTYEQIIYTRTQMRKTRRLMKYVIVHPDQMYDLMNEDKFINADYFQKEAIVNGLVGSFPGGIKVFEHTAVQSNAEGVGDAVTVYQAIALADRSVIYAQKVTPVFEFDEEVKRKRALTFHYYEAFGAKILHTEGVYVIKSSI